MGKSQYSDTYSRLQRSAQMRLSSELVWAYLPPRTIGTDQVIFTAVLEPAAKRKVCSRSKRRRNACQKRSTSSGVRPTVTRARPVGGTARTRIPSPGARARPAGPDGPRGRVTCVNHSQAAGTGLELSSCRKVRADENAMRQPAWRRSQRVIMRMSLAVVAEKAACSSDSQFSTSFRTSSS